MSQSPVNLIWTGSGLRLGQGVDGMQSFFPKELVDGLAASGLAQARKKSRLRAEAGGSSYPVLRLWPDGMAIDAEHTKHLRGLVDIYDGARHIFQCLIVASGVEGGLLTCSFKRATPVLDRAALDYVRREDAPAGYLPRA